MSMFTSEEQAIHWDHHLLKSRSLAGKRAAILPESFWWPNYYQFITGTVPDERWHWILAPVSLLISIIFLSFKSLKLTTSVTSPIKGWWGWSFLGHSLRFKRHLKYLNMYHISNRTSKLPVYITTIHDEQICGSLGKMDCR